MPSPSSPLFVSALAVVLGCQPAPPAITAVPADAPAATVASAPPSAPVAPAAAASAALAPPPLSGSLIVGNEEGVREVGYDGATLRTIARTPARRLRFAAGGSEVVFYVRATGEIRALSLKTGVARRLAALPRDFKTCGHMPDYETGHRFAVADLGVQADGDFVLDAGANAVCLTLMDRNANMVNVQVEARVDLTSGATLHRVAIGGECAAKPARWKDCAAPRTAVTTAAPSPAASLPVGVTEESVSPSGRWSVLTLPKDTGGDYIYRSLFLLDRQTSRAFPVVKGPFPAPVPLGDLARAAGEGLTGWAVGESPVRWLEHDALLVDSLLVVPERGAVEIEGDVAL